MQPFLKWAGGKRWLRHRFPVKPSEIRGRYIEPFVGSGAIFFDLCPGAAIIADRNEALISTYQAIADSPKLVRRYLAELSKLHPDEHYYQIRSAQFRSKARMAAKFLYLNRTCWNGLYRVNRKGEFNVPRGTKTQIISPEDDFVGWSRALSHAQILCQDFEDTISLAGEGDLVYCDPPYTVHHNKNGFLKYNETMFSWDDQKRLRSCLSEASKRGASVIVSNADHQSITDLYSDFGTHFPLDRASVISGESTGRGRYKELLVVQNTSHAE